jgi:predicted dehydrogenase
MARKLRVGVIGVGGISSSQHLPHWKSSPHAELVAFCDTNAERLAARAKEYGLKATHTEWRELIARRDLDVIDITTPNTLHAPMAVAALEAGKHVLCEKPIATSAVEAEHIIETSRRVNKLVMINHHFRFNRAFRELLKLSDQRHLGDPYFAHCRWHRRRRVPVAPTFLNQNLAFAGPMLDLGVHLLDLAMALMSYPKPVSVTGSLGTFLGNNPDMGGDWGNWDPKSYEVEDFATALFRFDTGATLFVETSWLGFHDTPEEWSVRILGTRGGLHWPMGHYVTESNRIPAETHVAKEPDRSAYERSIHSFAQAIIQGDPAPVPPEHALLVARMIDAIYLSSQKGCEVPIQGFV